MTVLYIFLGLLGLAILFFAKNYYNANQREKKLDRLEQERIRRNQDRYTNRKNK